MTSAEPITTPKSEIANSVVDLSPRRQYFVFSPAVASGKRQGPLVRRQEATTVWNIPKPAKNDTGHSTQKPVACMLRPVENNSSAGQAIYEPFSVLGTTLIAAGMSGRICLCVELSPAYVDVAVERWQAFTGEEAWLEATGQTLAEVRRERGGSKSAALASPPALAAE